MAKSKQWLSPKMFFDKPKVAKAMDAATKRALSEMGAFIRRTARTSIRKSKKTSLPGKPPRSHSGLLKKGIMFSYDAARKSVIIGPELIPSARRARPDTTVPNVLEYGGGVTFMRRKRVKRVRIAPRPFMRPAMQKEFRINFEKRWKNVLDR